MKEIVSSTPQRSIIGCILIAFVIGISAFMSGGKNILFTPLISTSALLILFLYRTEFPCHLSLYVKGALASLSLFVGFGIVSTFFASDLFLSIQALASWFSSIVLFVVGIVVFNDPFIRRSVGWVMIIVGFVSSVFAVFDFIFNGSGFSRLYGSFFDPNIYGGFLLVPFFLSFVRLIIGEKSAKHHFFLMGVSGFLLATIILTSSRGTWIAAVFGVACAFFFIIKNVHTKLCVKSVVKSVCAVAIFSIVTVGLVLVVRGGQGVSSKVSLIRSYETSSENGAVVRLHYINDAFRIFKMHPFIGSGLGNYVFDLRSISNNPAFFSINPHNIYVEILATLGLGGFVSLCSFIFFFFLFGYKKQKGTTPLSPLFIGGFAALGALLLHMGAEADSAYPSVIAPFFLFAGIVFGESMVSSKGQETKPNNTLFTLVIIITLAFTLSSLYVYRVQSAVLDGEYYFSKGKIDEAVAQYNQAISLAPFNSDVFLKRAITQERLALQERDTQKKEQLFLVALSDAESAVRLSSKNSNALNIQGRLLVSLGDYEEAKKVLLKSESLDLVNLEANTLLIGLYVRSGETEKALSEIDSLLSVYNAYVKTGTFRADPSKAEIKQYVSMATLVQNRLQSEK